MGLILRTNVSKAFWCNPSKNQFEDAKIGASGDGRVAWFDRLLNDGIVIPSETSAINVLLTGPPGTGKSTLALELGYRWTNPDLWPDQLLKGRKPRVLYVTTEAPADWVIANGQTYEWDMKAKAKSPDSGQNLAEGQVTVVRFAPWELVKELKPKSINHVICALADLFRSKDSAPFQLDVEALIIDSLNTIPRPEDRQTIYGALAKLAAAGPRIIIMVLDGASESRAHDVWEFASDLVLRLDRSYEQETSGKSGYMIRTIELVKARYQNHVLGRHQLKIQEGLTEQKFETMNESDRMRYHPYRREGGIFIFPSIHYVLSLYKRTSPSDKKPDDAEKSQVENLNSLLGGGYPRGRCTALVGQRGGHKSHLGYREILGRIALNFAGKKGRRPTEKALIISLRDDEGMVRQTLAKILANIDRSLLTENDRKLAQWKQEQIAMEKAREKLREYQRKDLLEIAYYPPGYITPEEFFHRVMLSMHRLKGSGDKTAHVTLLFNSLDQLSSRFPLCAKEPIFIPGIIQMLTAEQVSSFFVTAEDETHKTYGLDTMAELILDFRREQLDWEKYYPYLVNAFSKERVDQWSGKPGPNEQWQRQAVTLTVGRYAGGQAAGAMGILELISPGHWLSSLCHARDLFFLPPEPASASGRIPNDAA